MAAILGYISTSLAVLGVLLALTITWTSFRTFKKTGSATHQFAFAGFVFLTVGIIAEQILFLYSTLDFSWVHTIESLLFVVGFGFLYLSIR